MPMLILNDVSMPFEYAIGRLELPIPSIYGIIAADGPLTKLARRLSGGQVIDLERLAEEKMKQKGGERS